MMLPNDTRIAGHKTVAHWRAIRGRLDSGAADPKAWKTAFREFFKERIDTRYFQPIKALESMGQDKGEGFSIVTLHCSLIEFLESTIVGKTYKYSRNGKPPLGKFEYSVSQDMFIQFLKNREPFKATFSLHGTAEDFYVSVRCGLLHEARTKNGWRIKVDQSATQAIDAKSKIVYRNKMQSAFDQFMAWYEQALSSDDTLQRAFIRKFDSLCDE